MTTPHPQAILNLHVGDLPAREIEVQEVLDTQGRLSYKKLLNWSIRYDVDKRRREPKGKGWQIQTTYLNSDGEPILFRNDTEFAAAFREMATKEPITKPVALQCLVDVAAAPSPHPCVRGGASRHLPELRPTKNTSPGRTPRSWTPPRWTPPSPTREAKANAHKQLQSLLESFVCILARAMLILQAQMEGVHMIAQDVHIGDNQTRRTVGRNVERGLSFDLSDISVEGDTPTGRSPRAVAARRVGKAFKNVIAEVRSTVESQRNHQPVKEQPSLDPDFIHFRHTCDGCMHFPIVGIRYHALNIPDYDLCSSCMAGFNGEDVVFQPEQLARDRMFQRLPGAPKNVSRDPPPQLAPPADCHPSLLEQARISCKKKMELENAKLEEALSRSMVEDVASVTSDGKSETVDEVPQDMTKNETKAAEEEDEPEPKPEPKEIEVKDHSEVVEGAAAEAEEKKPVEKKIQEERVATPAPKTIASVPRKVASVEKASSGPFPGQENEPNVEKVVDALEQYVLSVGGFVHNCVENGKEVSQKATVSATVAAKETRKHAKTVSSVFNAFSKRAVVVAEESRKKAAAYAEAMKAADAKRQAAVAASIAAAEAESKRNAEVIKEATKKMAVKDATPKEAESEQSKNAVEEATSTDTKNEEVEETPETECEEHGIEEEKNEMDVTECKVADVNEEEKVEPTESETEDITEESPMDEEESQKEELTTEGESVSSPVLESEDEASASISLDEDNDSGATDEEQVPEDFVEEVQEEVEVALTEGALVIDSTSDDPITVPSFEEEGDWDVLEETKSVHSMDSDGGIARASVMIGSALYQSDLSRSAETLKTSEAATKIEGVEKPVISRSSSVASMDSSISLVSAASSDSSMSLVSAVSVLSMDSAKSVISVSDDESDFELLDDFANI